MGMSLVIVRMNKKTCDVIVERLKIYLVKQNQGTHKHENKIQKRPQPRKQNHIRKIKHGPVKHKGSVQKSLDRVRWILDAIKEGQPYGLPKQITQEPRKGRSIDLWGHPKIRGRTPKPIANHPFKALVQRPNMHEQARVCAQQACHTHEPSKSM